MKVLVTGGSGMLGSSLKIIQPNWIYLSSENGDLTDFETVRNLFKKHQPEMVIHLAANVGGLFKNQAKRLEMFNINLIINYNVLENAYLAGIKRIICCLSTCIFPEGLNRVITEKDLHLGEPHHSNYGYAYAKRIMEVQCRLYNETPGYHYQCIIPTNIYGPNDNFNIEDSHVIPGLIHKAYLHSIYNPDIPMTILGSGLPKRQFIYSIDLAKIIVDLVKMNNTESLLICSCTEKDEVSILDVAKLIAKEFNISDVITSEITFEQNDGQMIKTVCPSRLLELLTNYVPLSLEKGIQETVYWFKENYPNIRL
jgi:GDP-L-fucose synthase